MTPLNRRLSLLSVFVLAAPLSAQTPDPLQEGFRRVDADGDGRISPKELERFPRLKIRVSAGDTGGNGFLSFEEFRDRMLATGGASPSGVSGADKLTPGDHTRTVKVGEVERRYRVHVPPGYDAAKATPVVIAFHGGGGNPESMVRLSGLNAKSDEAGFLVVYPYGSGVDPERGLSFNGGECCGYAMFQEVDDVGFARALLDDLASVANVDSDRVFATGLSNGGIMAHHVASELSDRIAAIAPIGGPLMMPESNATLPVPVMHFHGTADEFAPFKGGYGKGATGGKGVTEFRSVEHTIQAWVKANGCKAEPWVEVLPDTADDGMTVTRKTWSGGREGSEVVLVEIEGGGHTWPGMEPIVALLGPSTMDVSANDLMWEFFQRHPRKTAPAESSTGQSTLPLAETGIRILRTPEERFAKLPGYDFEPNYVMVDAERGGKLRMHYIDAGPKDAPTVLMLHGNPTWSYLFREVIPLLNAAGYRTIALDYIGMGRSDKPAGYGDYSYDRHLEWIRQGFAQIDEELGLGRTTIFGHDYGVPFGIRLMAEHYPERFDAFINANASLPVGTHIAPTHLKWRQFVRDNPDVPVGNVISSRIEPPLTSAEIAAWNAPYPDASYKMAIRSFPEMVPDSPQRPEAIANTAAWQFMENFQKPFMTIFGGFDAVSLPSARLDFIRRVPGAFGQQHAQLDVTHYAPEDKPEDVAREVIQFLADVYVAKPFTEVFRTDFAKGIHDSLVSQGSARSDAETKALQLSGGASLVQQSRSMDLTRCDALKVAMRYVPYGFEDGGGFVAELWNGAEWTRIFKQTAGAEFRNGAEDYAFAHVDSQHAKFAADARLRIRMDAANHEAVVSVRDLALYQRLPLGMP